MISQKAYPLTQRGFHQAERNNSHQLWSILQWQEEISSIKEKKHDENNNTKMFTQKQNIVQLQQDFRATKNNQRTDSKVKEINQARQNYFIKTQNQTVNINLEQQQAQFQKLKTKSIQKYLKGQVPFTRTLSNSAFRKFYQRPCQEAYGRHTKISGFGTYLKTHNVEPHTLDNKPSTYQTFSSALMFGKRAKIDINDRQKRIQRQLSKNIDYRLLKSLAHKKVLGQADQTKKQIGPRLKIDHKKSKQKSPISQNTTKPLKMISAQQQKTNQSNLPGLCSMRMVEKPYNPSNYSIKTINKSCFAQQ